MNSLLNVSYPSWMDRAACSDSDADFFPKVGQNARPAKAVCDECPVKLACLTWAIEQRINDGVFGGLTPHERYRLGDNAAPTPCPDCGRLLRSTASLPLHARRWCKSVAA